MKYFSYLIISLLFSYALYAQVTPVIPSGTVMGNTSGAAAAPKPVITGTALAVFDISTYGAKCDGVTDDAAAFNSAFTAIRAVTALSGSGAQYLGQAAHLVTPARVCLIKSTINATVLYGAGFTWDGEGTLILCQTNGTPCVDATGVENVTIRNLNIYGSATLTPNIGLAIGRYTSTSGNLAGNNVFDAPKVIGYFTSTPFFDNQAETTHINSGWFLTMSNNNWAAAVFDGENHFNFQTIAAGGPYPQNTAQGFAESTCTDCVFMTFGTASPAVWIGGAWRLRLANSYVGVWGGTGGNDGVILYTPGSISNLLLDADLHFELNPSLNSAFRFAGAAAITQFGLHVRDHSPQVAAGSSFFARDTAGTYGTAVSTVAINDANIELGGFVNGGATLFDNAAQFTVNGLVNMQPGNWTAPASFSGNLCLPVCQSYAQPGNTSNIAIGPSTMQAAVTGSSNLAIMPGALSALTGGLQNVAIGTNSLGAITSGTGNTAIGFLAGAAETGSYNTAYGWQALSATGLTGATNVALGGNALEACTGVCASNVAVGSNASNILTTGANNLVLGNSVGTSTLTTGSNNILLGNSNAVDTVTSSSSNEVNIAGLLFYNNAALGAPAVSACGTSPAIDARANNRSGTVTVGSGAVASCTITFAGSGYGTWNHCRVTPHSTVAAFAYSYTKTVLTVTATSATSLIIDYDCDGY